MLSEEVIDKVVERLVNRIETANEYVLKEIGKSIKEVGEITPSKRNQLIQTLKYGGDFDKIIKRLAEIADMNVYDIYKIFEEIAKNDYRFAKQFYDYKKKKYIPYKLNEALQSQVRALASMTAQEYLNLTNTKALGFGVVDKKTGEVTYKGLKETYYDLLDEAVVSISQGKETFDEAMYRQLKQVGESGLKVVYESGRAVRLDSAVRMCVKSGLTNMHMEMQKQIGDEFGSDGVEITVHNNPAPDHEDAQGCQFSTVKPSEDEPSEWEKLQTTGQATTYDGKNIDMIRYHSFRPIGTMNCYHYTFSIVLGVNKPQYSDDDLQKIKDKNNEGFDLDGKHYTMYEGTQLQRQLESAIRTQKDELAMGKASGNQKLIDKSEMKLRQLNKKYNELNKASGLRPKLDRLRNVDFGVKPGQNRAVSGIEKPKDDVLSTPIPTEAVKSKLKEYNVNIDESLYDEKTDEELVNRTLNQVNNLVDKYPILKSKIKKDGLVINADWIEYAGDTSYIGDRITLSKGLYSNKEKFLSLIKEGQDDDWSAKIYEKNYDIYTITHEMGHVLEDAIMDKRIKTRENFTLSQAMETEFGMWKIEKMKHQEDVDIFNEVFLPVSDETGISWSELNKQYISDYGKSASWFEWFAELFTKMELGEEDVMTRRLKEYLEKELWKN